MISALQSEQISLLQLFYDQIHIPSSELPEFERHGARVLIQTLRDVGFVVVRQLSDTEKTRARQISAEIASHPLAKDRDPQGHYPEAEAIVLMSRAEFRESEIILDELAAREVAKEHQIPVIGFAGLLIRACQDGYLSPEQVRETLYRCQSLGTHYATAFIKGIYRRLKEETG